MGLSGPARASRVPRFPSPVSLIPISLIMRFCLAFFGQISTSAGTIIGLNAFSPYNPARNFARHTRSEGWRVRFKSPES